MDMKDVVCRFPDDASADKRSIEIKRNILYSKDVNDFEDKDSSLKAHCHKSAKRFKKKLSVKAFLGIFPIITWLKTYDWKKYLIADILSGITITCIHIPQGLSSSLVLGVKPESGIYSSCLPPLMYVIFGESRHLSTGPFLTLSLLVSNGITSYLANGNSQSMSGINGTTLMNSTLDNDISDRTEVSLAFGLAIGIWLLIFGLFSLGAVACIFSEPFMDGLINAISLSFFISQISGFLGVKVKRTSSMFSNIDKLSQIFSNISSVNFITLSLACCAFIFSYSFNWLLNIRLKKKIKFYVPVELILISVSILVSHFLDLNKNYEVSVIGHIPTGMKSPELPNMKIASHLILESFMYAFIIFAATNCYCGYFSKLLNTPKVSPNQELLAFSAMNTLGSFFHSVPCGAAFSRSKIQVSSNSKSQITSIVASILVIIFITNFGMILYSVPKCILSAIIILNIRNSMINIAMMKELWKISKYDLSIYLLTYFVGIFTNINFGMIIGVIYSLAVILFRMFKTKMGNIYQYKQSELFVENTKVKEDGNCAALKFNGPLNFISRNIFMDKIEVEINRLLASSSYCSKMKETKYGGNIDNNEESAAKLNASDDSMKRRLILNLDSVSYIDFSGISVLKTVFDIAKSKNVALRICCNSASIYHSLKSPALSDYITEDILYASVYDAACEI